MLTPLGHFLCNNFNQAVKNLSSLLAQLEATRNILNLKSDEIFLDWCREEKAYLVTLKKEPPSDILAMQYLDVLKKLCTTE